MVALFPLSAQRKTKVRVLPRFPARVEEGAGINITRAAGVYTFALQFSSLTPIASLADDDKFVVERADGSFAYILNEDMPTGGGSGDMLAATYDPQNIADDAFDRANHTGTQLLATISDAGALAALDLVGITDIDATGTPDNTTFLRGDGAWSVPAGSGDVSKVGTPVDGQIGVWTGDGTIEGDSALTFDTSDDSLIIAASGNLKFGAVTVLDDAAGTMTLSNIDALDATTEATIEAAIDTLANLTSIQGRTIALADAGADALLGWDDSASAYQNLSAADARVALALATTSDVTFNSLSLADQIFLANGSATDPAYSFTNDPNTGMYGNGSDALLFTAGGTTRFVVNTTSARPNTNDGIALGAATLSWADLFLASGGVINWNNGNATLTHSAGLLTSNVPLSLGTSNAFTAGTIELGAASDTTLSRASAGVLAVEGVNVLTTGSGRERLTADRTYYVRTDGSDSNNGLANTSGGAFLTIQKALDTIADTIDIGGKTVVVQVGAGTYTGAVSMLGRPFVGGIVTLRGDTTTPANVIISMTSASAFDLRRGMKLYVEGLKVQTATSGHGFHISNGSYLGITGNMDFGAIAQSAITVDHESVVGISSSYSITGAQGTHWAVSNNSDIEAVQGPPTITITGTPAFGTAFATADLGGTIDSSATYSGSATGVRFTQTRQGVIRSTNTMPGDTAGTYSDFTTADIFVAADGDTLVIGNTASVAIQSVTPSNQTHGLSTNTAASSVTRWSNDAGAPRIFTAKSRGTTVGTHTVVADADVLGEVLAYGSNGSAFRSGSIIRTSVDGTPGTGNDMPSKIELMVSPDASASPAAGITIRQDRSIEFNGISTTASAANAFIDNAANNEILRSTSSLRFKKDVEPVDENVADAFLAAVEPIWYRSLARKDKLEDGREKSFYSFGAEALADIDPRLVNWGYRDEDFDTVIDEEKVEGPDGQIAVVQTSRRVLKEGARLVPDGVNDRAILAMLVSVAKRQDARIAALEMRLYGSETAE